MATTPSYLDAAAKTIKEVIAPNAIAVDRDAAYPRDGMMALGRAGLLGLVSAKDVGGMGEGLRAAAQVVEQVGAACGSTGMVLCMHYCAVWLLEKHGPRATREAIAAGNHITTLAFSEVGSRSHFWVPLSSATEDPAGGVRLNANKSFATSAGEADSYVWSSKPLHAEGLSTIWLVPGKAPGLSFPSAFDGLGLRGNSSGPIKAVDVVVPRAAMLGADGDGFELAQANLVPWFLILASACYIGITESATTKAGAHVVGTQFAHLSQALVQLPTIRAFLAQMRIKTDMARAFLLDTLSAMEEGRPDAQLRVLQIKAAVGEIATEVTELAMRICGGAAFRKEVGLERHFRDARAATVMSPTTDVLYDLVGKAIAGLPLF